MHCGSVNVDLPTEIGRIAAEHELSGRTEKGETNFRVPGPSEWLLFLVLAQEAINSSSSEAMHCMASGKVKMGLVLAQRSHAQTTVFRKCVL